MIRKATRPFTSGLAWCLLVLGTGLPGRAAAAAAEVAPSNAPAAAVRSNLVVTATAAERAGRLAEAAAAYEALLAADDTHAAVLAPRLVRLYTLQNRPERALAWAHKAMLCRPEPDAYLAGVHAQLGQLKEAELLLRNTVRNSSDPKRRVPLLWQLSDVHAQQGAREASLQALSAACDAAQGTSLQDAAVARLEAYRARPVTAHAHGPLTRSQEEAKP